MALSKNDWFKIGEEQGFVFGGGKVHKPTLGAPTEGSWQRTAWDAGFEAGHARKTAQGTSATNPDPTLEPNATGIVLRRDLAAVLEDRRHEAFANYPPPVREHLRVIAHQVVDERDSRRRDRLMRTFTRMGKRYGPLLPSTTTH